MLGLGDVFMKPLSGGVRGLGVYERLSQCPAGGTLDSRVLGPPGQPDVSLEIHPGERRLDDLFVNRCCLHETASMVGASPSPVRCLY